MAVTATRPQPRRAQPAAGLTSARRWGVAQTLALVGILFLVWQAITLAGWLVDGPYQITEFRDRGATSWWFARIYEGVAIVLALVMGTYVVRKCLRERRLVFDAQLCIATLAAFWLDPAAVFLQPIWFYSSNWVNLSSWTANMPGVVNPAAGQLAEPVLFLGLVYTFGLLAFAMLLNAVMRAIHTRWPGMSVARLVACVFLIGIAIDLAFEIPMFQLGMWAFPGAPHELTVVGGGSHRLPIIEVLMAGMVFTGLALVRYFRDDRGQTFIDRSAERTGVRRKAAVGVLALIGVTNSLLFVGDVGLMPVGFYSDPYPDVSDDLRNDNCGPDTSYGPCPGSPGYRIPLNSVENR